MDFHASFLCLFLLQRLPRAIFPEVCVSPNPDASQILRIACRGKRLGRPTCLECPSARGCVFSERLTGTPRLGISFRAGLRVADSDLSLGLRNCMSADLGKAAGRANYLPIENAFLHRRIFSILYAASLTADTKPSLAGELVQRLVRHGLQRAAQAPLAIGRVGLAVHL